MREKSGIQWGIRIVGHGRERASQLLAHPQNWRTHGFLQEGALSSVLNDVGFVQSVLVNKRSSPEWGRERGIETMLDGHLRVKAAMARDDETELPVTYVDLSPAEERRVLLTFDPIGAMAGQDKDLVAALRAEVVTEWPEENVDLDAILKKSRERTKGLSHNVNACTCCEKRCKPGCGCWRDEALV
jgi:hypothetical protein